MRFAAVILCFVITVGAAAAQPAAGQAKPADAAPSGAAQAASPDAPAIPPKGFTYDAEGRRDPFVSILRSGSDPEQPAPAVRRPGLGGLMISEVSLKGTVASHNGFVAILQGPDAKTYIVREGEKLFDGTVRSITQNTLTLLQVVNDPGSKEIQREVRKVLRQTDEAK